MKFCLLTTFFPPQHFGGDAIFVATLANALVDAGHSVEVVHCADSFDLLRNEVRRSPLPIDGRVIVHTLRSGWGTLSPFATYMTGRPGFKRGSIERILSQGFDVIHWHNLSLVGGPAALQCGNAVKLCTLHDYWLMCPTSILFRYNREVCTERTCIRCSLVYGRPPQLWRASDLLKSSLLHVDRFLAPSKFVRDIFRKSDLGIDATVLPHFVSPVAGTRVGLDAADRSYYLVASRLEKAKGIQTILPLFRNTNRKLLIAGAGNYEGELRRQARNCSQIEFLGRIPHQQLGEVYASARATIVPSICLETFGLTILESLERGTPVIASNFGALPEVLAETEGGVVYSDIAGLESILRRFDSDSDYARALGISGQAMVARKYSADVHLREYLRIVDEELSSRQRRLDRRQA